MQHGIDYNLLVGTLPMEMAELTALEKLDLAYNILLGEIPSEWGQRLSRLEVLSLYRNRLSGILPDSIGRLTSLRVIDLWGNYFRSHIPESITKLPLLEVLRLPTNLKQISPVTMASVGDLKALELEEHDHGKVLNNVVTSHADAFSDICCGLGEEMAFGSDETTSTTLTFCDFEPDFPGVDATYEDFIMYFGGSIFDVIRPTSSFMSEAAISAELCAEYCNIVEECRYFSFDSHA